MSAKCCGRCAHFTLVDAPRASEGEGRCTIYGDGNPEPLVRWDHAWTVLFTPVKDRVASDRREAWIQQMRRKESADVTADAAPAASAGPPSDERDRVATSPHPTKIAAL
jgi:hypothetical protein